MDIKINNPTLNRPEGFRLLDAPAVQVNFNDFVQQLKEEKAWKTSDRNAITVFKTDGVTIVISALHKGATITDLQIEGLLLLQVMDGVITVNKSDVSAQLSDKQLLVLHPGEGCTVAADEDAVLQLSYIRTAAAKGESVI